MEKVDIRNQQFNNLTIQQFLSDRPDHGRGRVDSNSTVPQFHNSTVPQFHNSTIPQLHNSTTPQFHNSTTPQFHNSTIQQFHNSTTPQLHNSTIPQFHNSTTPQFHNSTTPQFHNSTTPQLHKKRRNFYWISMIYLLGLILMATACQSEGGRNDKFIVAVAANVQYAIDEIEVAFETQSGIEMEVITGSSGKLTAQIQQGAPYDMLVSADMKYPQSLYEKGFAASPPQVYAYGALVLWTLRDLSLDSIVALLQQPEVRKIALANPKIAPYGGLALQWLQYHQLLPAVESKLIYGESIAQASQYVSSGACDIGFTASSIVVSPGMKDKGRWVSLKPDFKLEQGVVITKRGEKQPLETKAFFDFLFSDTARAIFSRYGYEVPISNQTN